MRDTTPQVWYNERHAPQVCYRMEAGFYGAGQGPAGTLFSKGKGWGSYGREKQADLPVPGVRV